MGLKETFRKQGGWGLIRQYARGGALGTALAEFLLLGKSRIALEILRLAAQFKTRQKLARKFAPVLDEFAENSDDSLPHETSDKVWICWLRGIENAPPLVQRCCRSVRENLGGRDITVLSAKTMGDYVDFPGHVMDKWKKGIIPFWHLPDMLRLELLIRHGGLWLDSTVFCSAPEREIPRCFFDSDLFFYQTLKPGRDGKSTYPSSWLLSARTNNRVLMAVRDLLYAYWKRNDSMWDYFLLHDFFSIVLERFADDWHRVPPRDNATPHILLLRLFDPFDNALWAHVRAQTPFHKLSYKLDPADMARPDTFYKRLIEEG